MFSISLVGEEAGDVVGGVAIGTGNAMAVDVQVVDAREWPSRCATVTTATPWASI